MSYRDFCPQGTPSHVRATRNVGGIFINRIRCNLCNDVITSEHRHDYKECRCRNASVDGGSHYIKYSCILPNSVEWIGEYYETDKSNAINRFSGVFCFLSNFHYAPMVIDDVSYDTNEHYFQAMKAAAYEDHLAIARSYSPGEAKRLGRKVRMRPDWDNIRMDVMMQGLRKKFENPQLRHLLVETGDIELVEGNTWGDVYWGVDERTGKGENHLGKLLMRLREELKND